MFKVILPAAGFILLVTTAASAQPVTIKPGDTLSKIAARELGDGSRWTELCELNKSALGSNCDLLTVGTSIQLSSTSQPVAPANDADAPPSARDSEAEVSGEHSPAEDTQITTAEEAVVVTPFAPQLIDVENTGEQHEGEPILLGRTDMDAGEHRIRYGFSPEGETQLHVEWRIQADFQSDPLITVFGSSTDVIGRVYLVGSDQATSDGSVTAASITTENEWSTITFTISTSATEPFVQLLYYPAGTSESALDREYSFKFTAPKVYATN